MQMNKTAKDSKKGGKSNARLKSSRNLSKQIES
jgi:hypothetical protein